MTRRKFIQKIIKSAAAVAAGVLCLAKKAVPRKFMRAVKTRKFPGLIKPLRNIGRQSKWSG